MIKFSLFWEPQLDLTFETPSLQFTTLGDPTPGETKREKPDGRGPLIGQDPNDPPLSLLLLSEALDKIQHFSFTTLKLHIESKRELL